MSYETNGNAEVVDWQERTRVFLHPIEYERAEPGVRQGQ
jgi:hypothetical protein